MKNNAYLLICFCFSVIWGCKIESVERFDPKQTLYLRYNGNNILGKAFVESLELKNERYKELENVVGTSKQLMLDYTIQGGNINTECFYVIPLNDEKHNFVDACLLATIDLKIKEKDDVKISKFEFIDKEVLLQSDKSNQYEAYFLMWNKSGLKIKPELYHIAEKLHEERFKRMIQPNGYYQTYEYKVDYRWDYSMLLFPSNAKVKIRDVRSVFNDMIYWLQGELGIDPIYNARADTTSLYVSFYAPRYTLDEIRAVTKDFGERLRNGIDLYNTPTFMGINYKYYNESVKGYQALPDPNPENPSDPWIPENPSMPEKPSMPEDNKLEIHRKLLNSVFTNMPKAFLDSLFKGDSLADSRDNRYIGKSYIHALVEYGQLDEKVLSDMRIFFIKQMELFFDTDNAVYLAMALHPILDSYCLGHEKKYWMNEEWHYDVLHRFEGKFIFYNDESAAIRALQDIFQSVFINGQQDLNTIFNAWLYSFSYGPLNSANIVN